MRLPEDPIIREMLPDFVQSWRRDINEKYSALVEQRNETELFRMGHTLRGSGRQFNLDHMSELGAQLQELARHADWNAMTTLKNTMTEELDKIQKYLIDNNISPPTSFTDLPSNI